MLLTRPRFPSKQLSSTSQIVPEPNVQDFRGEMLKCDGFLTRILILDLGIDAEDDTRRTSIESSEEVEYTDFGPVVCSSASDHGCEDGVAVLVDLWAVNDTPIFAIGGGIDLPLAHCALMSYYAAHMPPRPSSR